MKYNLLLGSLEFFLFLLATINLRAAAKNWLRATLVTDALIASNGFIITKLIADTKAIEDPQTMAGWICYVVGATLGSYVGMMITKRWKDNDGGTQGNQAV